MADGYHRQVSQADAAVSMIDVLAALASPDATTLVAAPGVGDGYWAGGPSAVAVDGDVWLAYRLRRPVDRGRGYANVIARSGDGVSFETVAVLTSSQCECASLQRPDRVALPGGGWRLVGCRC